MRSAVRASAATLGAWGGYLALTGRWNDPVAFHIAHADSLIRPLLVQVLPPAAVVALYSGGRGTFVELLSSSVFADIDGAQRPTKAFGLTFRNDLGNAAGLDKDGSMLDFNYRVGAGFAVVGTVLARAHGGNLEVGRGRWTPLMPLPSSGGAVNSLGLPSKGIDVAVANIAAFRERRSLPVQVAHRAHRDTLATRAAARGAPSQPFPIGVSIMGHPEDFGAAKLSGILRCVRASLSVADFIEINESCPNCAHHDGSLAEQRARVGAIVAARDEYSTAHSESRRVPILVKLGTLGTYLLTTFLRDFSVMKETLPRVLRIVHEYSYNLYTFQLLIH